MTRDKSTSTSSVVISASSEVCARAKAVMINPEIEGGAFLELSKLKSNSGSDNDLETSRSCTKLSVFQHLSCVDLIPGMHLVKIEL